MTTNNFQIEFFVNAMSSAKLEFGEYQVDLTYNGWGKTNGRTFISLYDTVIVNYAFFNLINWQETNSMKFTFRIIDGILYFFFNEKLIHNREVMLDNINDIQISTEKPDCFEKVVVSLLED